MTIPAQPTIYDGSTLLTVGGQPTEIVNDQRIVDWIKSLSPNGATQYDTGWVNLVLKSGFTVQGADTPRIRRIGSIVYARGRIAGTFTSGVACANLPSGFPAPTGLTDIALTRTSVGNSPSALARGELNTSGDLSVFFGTASTTAPTWVGLPPVLYVAV